MITKGETITLEKGRLIGYHINLGKAPLLILQARKGYLMCGYLNMSTADKFGDIAGKVTGVTTYDDMLNATVIEVSETAKQEGFHQGMNARDFLNKLL